MPTSTSAPRWAPTTVALLTLAWVLAVLGLLWWSFSIGMQGWADQHSNSGAREEELGRRGGVVLLVLAAVAVGGAVLIAVVAFTGRLRWTGVVYLGLALALGALALPLAAGAYRRLTPPSSPPPPAPNICQEHSGGDTRCPGRLIRTDLGARWRGIRYAGEGASYRPPGLSRPRSKAVATAAARSLTPSLA
jgi:hypothetical protein